MAGKIFLNGKWVDHDQAVVSVFDHGLLYGDGVFEGIRSYGGKIFRLTEHVERLYDSAKAIRLTIPYDPRQMSDHIKSSVRTNGLKDGYIRAVVTRGAGDLGLDPDKCQTPTVFIIADSITLYPKQFYDEGLSIVTVPTRRNVPEALNPRIKSLNYLNNILAKIEGKLSGCVEALMLTDSGFVCECTGDNIFCLRQNVLLTPPVYLGALKGITRGVVMDLAAARGLTVQETPFTRHELFTADEVFLTGTAAEIVPVTRLDGRVIGSGRPGPQTRALTAAFRDLVAQEGEDAYAV
ncbi:MAG: branched-chain-amino-acid transaminase [Candidatus Lindowbacteria bacterium RIFCSPLOWO2_12_FULL_62_27]|nr:MAG: branched-chain-amino-acid transaminase [Candidatus Lindowbacteria bacterium RIFCSPLOWO2_12_FULL_62_27]OGH62823.1 MAG: branched-chain-amino-acid transaminase [Candidatus Lindowbacteria bacterium RIFCSPLOWO2_02_FULL_62_12]